MSKETITAISEIDIEIISGTVIILAFGFLLLVFNSFITNNIHHNKKTYFYRFFHKKIPNLHYMQASCIIIFL